MAKITKKNYTLRKENFIAFSGARKTVWYDRHADTIHNLSSGALQLEFSDPNGQFLTIVLTPDEARLLRAVIIYSPSPKA